MQEKIRKLKAIKQLAERGEGGEKIAAKEKLDKLCKLWNISPDLLEDSAFFGLFMVCIFSATALFSVIMLKYFIS